MHQLDADQDNFVTREEAKSDPVVMEYFNESDVDKDGKLSEEVFMAIDETVTRKTKSEYLSDSFGELDTGDIGKLSREELDADSPSGCMFDERDMNKDSGIENPRLPISTSRLKRSPRRAKSGNDGLAFSQAPNWLYQFGAFLHGDTARCS